MISLGMKEKLKSTFAWERVICRIITAWTIFAMTNLSHGKNYFDLEYAQSTPLSKLLLISLAAFCGLSLLNFCLTRHETDSMVLMGTSTVCIIFWLTAYSEAEGQTFLVPLAITVIYILFAIYFVNKNERLFERLKLKKGTLIGFAIFAALFTCAVMSAIGCLRYLCFASPNFDFGIFVNMFYNMKESFKPLVSSERDVLMSHFAVHISPIYYVLLPFYYIFPSPMTLQIGQAVAVSSGIIPLLLLCKHKGLSRRTTAIVAFIFALYPALSTNGFYDIHENCFLVPLLLWAFYFLEREKFPLVWLFSVLTLGVKEDAAVYICIFGLFIFFSKKKYLHGALLCLTSVAYFALALWLLSKTSAEYTEMYATATPNPAIAGPMINRFDNLIFNTDDGILGALKTALTNPGYLLTQLFTEADGGWDKITYVLQLFLPLGFIPFVTKNTSRWLLLVPMLTNLLTMYQYQYNNKFQYSYGVSAFLLYAFILNLSELKRPTKKALMTIAASSVLCLYMFSVMPVLTSRAQVYSTYKSGFNRVEEALDTIPEDASVAASSFLVPHIADRKEIYETKYHKIDDDTEYVALDIRYADEKAKIEIYERLGYEKTLEVEGWLVIMKLKNPS